MDDKDLQLYQEENRQALIDLNKSVDRLIKLFSGEKIQIKQDIIQPSEVTVKNPVSEVSVKEIDEFRDTLKGFGSTLKKTIENNSYKPLKEVSLKNPPKEIKVNNFSDLKALFKNLEASIKQNKPIINITKDRVVFPNDARNYVSVRLTDGKSFYNAISQAISAGGGGGIQEYLIDRSGASPAVRTTASIIGDVTLSSEVEVKNDAGNPVPVSATSLPLASGAATSVKQDNQITELQDIESDVEAINTRLGEVQPSPTSNTVLDRLKTIGTNTTSLDAKQDALALLLKYDEGATYTYIGNAVPGTATSSALWRIKRLTNADNTIVWAGGNGNFVNIWDNREALTYS